jgi:CubicO group peptidase (beta-lactamase class C family)
VKNTHKVAFFATFLILFRTNLAGFGTKNDVNLRVDALLSSATRSKQPGAAVLVSRNGKISFAKGYGVRNLRTSSKIDPETSFRLASFTKQFTAVAIMLLVHDGKLHYGSRLTEIFPEFPEYGRAITVRNLLNHTGGLPDYEDLMDKEERAGKGHWSADHQIQDSEVLALLEQRSAGKFAPGTSWAYSNSGYVVLGLIVAKTAGMPFEDFLAQRIFSPLQMKHTLVYVKGKNTVVDRAYGHSIVEGVLRETDQSSTSATLGDGGIYSNLNDLAKWDDALRKNTLLSASEMAPAREPVKLADGSEPHWPNEPDDSDNLAPGKPVSYGFGWFLDPYDGHARMWHTGSTSGFRTVIERFTQDGLTIIILCNRTDLDPRSLAESIAKIELPSP